MLVCQYCKTTFHKKVFFCSNCLKPILNEYGCQLHHPLLADKNEDLSFQDTEWGVFYFDKKFENYEKEDVNFYIQINEIIKLLYFFCEKTEHKKVVFGMTIEGDGQLIEPVDFILYEHGEKLYKIEKDLKNSIRWHLDIYKELDGITIKKIEKIQVRLELLENFDFIIRKNETIRVTSLF